jgi:predicted Zn-dependent protease with MMP-like domain
VNRIMERERFERLVAEAVRNLPEEFKNRLENIDVVVEERPASYQLTRAGLSRGMTLLGLYEGVPLTRRSSYYGMVPPDKITIFQEPIEERCRSEDEITSQVQRVVRHEIAHHFGISDARLSQIERRQKRPPLK